MDPLRQLARRTNTAVLAAHHKGKSGNENAYATDKAHLGRGASSLGDQSWLVLNLDRDFATKQLVLNCGKSKGEAFVDTWYELDRSTRWFKQTDQRNKVDAFQRWFDKTDPDTEISTDELKKLATSPGSGERHTKRAVRQNLLEKVRHGVYLKPQTVSP